MSNVPRRFDADSDDEEECKGSCGGSSSASKPTRRGWADSPAGASSNVLTRFEEPELEALDFSDEESDDDTARAVATSSSSPHSETKAPASRRFSPEDDEEDDEAAPEGGARGWTHETKSDDTPAKEFAPVSPERKARGPSAGDAVQQEPLEEQSPDGRDARRPEEWRRVASARAAAEAAYDSADDDVRPFDAILAAPPSTLRGMVETLVVRNRSGMCRLFPEYQLFFQNTNTMMLFASKQAKNRTSNYHMFDMTRGMGFGSKLTKKSGNYIGKLRSNYAKTENVIVSNHTDRRELGVILFNKPSMVEQIKDGSQPRKMYIVVPEVDADGVAVPVRQKRRDEGLLECLRTQQLDGLAQVETKEPTYDNGNYRLNFNGRVTVPSVKNFQLVAQDDRNTVIMQFGKVGEDRFHMDFRAPLTAVQAFAIVLSQFNF